MRIFFLVGCALILQSIAVGQHKFILPQDESLADYLILDPAEVRENYKSTIPEKFQTPELERMTHLYADNIAHSICNKLTSGKVYTNWPEMDEYLMTVMENVIPEELRQDEVMRPYLYRAGFFNASMYASGVMMVNVGAWPYLESEAALAALIAHEVAHYYSHHSLKSYLRSQGYTKRLDLGTGGKSMKSQLKASREAEIEADSLSHVWVSQSPYSMEGSLELIRILERSQDLWMKRSETKTEPKATSHPLSDERVELVLSVKNAQEGGGAMFVQDKAKFHALKKQAVIESLEAKLRDFHFRTAVELAFKFHILEPDEKIYVSYLMESIRRLCYQDSDYWAKNFITDGYYGEKISEIQDEKRPITAHLFERFDPEIMSMSPGEMRKIQARFYWQGDLKFRTNEEAFMFYYSLGKALECGECELSEALSRVSDQEARDNALKNYTNTESPSYSLYADILLEDKVFEGLEKKKLTVFDRFYGYVSQGQEPIPVNIQSKSGEEELLPLLESALSGVENREMIYLPSLRETNMEEYVLLHELKEISDQKFYSKGVRPELHLIDPRYLGIFKKYGVDEIEFVTCRYTEYRKKEKSMEEYEAVMSMSYDELFNMTNSTRYFEVYLSSLREVEKGRMKYQYYSDQIKMNFKDDSRSQMIRDIPMQLRTKDDRMIKDHYYYKQSGGY